MAFKNSKKTISRLPIKITIDKEDLESDDEIPELVFENRKSTNYKQGVKLSSQLETGIEDVKLYIDVNPQIEKKEKNSLGKDISIGSTISLAHGLSKDDKLMEKSVLKPGFEKLEAVPAYSESTRHLKMERRKLASKSKGDKWFNLPATEMTEEKLRDLEVIQMRSILNPKQFYKKNDLKVLPKYFQVGTVVDSAADFYHGRVPRKDRKKTLVDELMADANFQRYNKRNNSSIFKICRTFLKYLTHFEEKRNLKHFIVTGNEIQ
nr:EOG090X0GO7 [Eurycercus lamellatus]